MKKLFILLVMFVFSLGCNFQETPSFTRNYKFFLKYRDTDFSEFFNHSFQVRGFDSNSNPIVLVYKNDSVNCIECRVSFKIIIDTENHNVIEMKSLPSNIGDCLVDSAQASYLAVKFVKYNISYLFVDADSNAFFSVMQKEAPPELVKFHDGKNVGEEYLQSWSHLGGNWYEKTE